MRKKRREDGVSVRFPVWMIVDADKHKAHGLPKSLAVLGCDQYAKFAPLFTTADLAWRFVHSMERPGRVPIRLIKPQALKVILADLKKVGCTTVGLDVLVKGAEGGGADGRFYESDHIINAIPHDRHWENN